MKCFDKSPGSRPRPAFALRTAVLSAAALALVSSVAACAGSGGAASSGSTVSGAAAPGVTYARQQVAAAMKDPAAPVPSAAISDISKLRGKTIYYVPLSSDVPAFAITAATMKTALAKVGVNLDVCSGNFNPSQYDACFSQAIGANAAAIVSDSIPVGLTESLIKQASAKGIGVVVTDQNTLSGQPQGKNIAYIPGNDAQYQLAQDWIIQDSGGSADALELEDTDSPTTEQATSQYALPELKKHCPGCKETLLKFSSSNQQNLPSLISSALLKNPDINYISPQYDQYVSYVVQGIQQATATTRVKMAATASALSGMQDVATSSSTVKAEIADNQVYNGWIDADEGMRTALGQTPVSYTIPVRLFTSANIGGVQLSNAGQASGTWFGTDGYEQQFEKLWGV